MYRVQKQRATAGCTNKILLMEHCVHFCALVCTHCMDFIDGTLCSLMSKSVFRDKLSGINWYFTNFIMQLSMTCAHNTNCLWADRVANIKQPSMTCCRDQTCNIFMGRLSSKHQTAINDLLQGSNVQHIYGQTE